VPSPKSILSTRRKKNHSSTLQPYNWYNDLKTRPLKTYKLSFHPENELVLTSSSSIFNYYTTLLKKNPLLEIFNAFKIMFDFETRKR
jgi:hypothetical protein